MVNLNKRRVEVSLDLYNPNRVIDTSNFKQGDWVVIEFFITLMENNVPIVISDGSNISVKVQHKETKYTYDIPTDNVSVVDGGLLVELVESATDFKGEYLLGVGVNQDSGIVDTFVGVYDIAENPFYKVKSIPPSAFDHYATKDDLKILMQKNFTNASVGTPSFENLLVNSVSYKAQSKSIGNVENEITTKANDNLDNVAQQDRETFVSTTNAFKHLEQQENVRVKGLNADQIRKLFEANYGEPQDDVDWGIAPYNSATVFIQYNPTSNNQVINQVLPPIANNQIIMIMHTPNSNITGTSLSFTGANGELIDGSAVSKDFTDTGYLGYFMPTNNINAWLFIPASVQHNYGISVSDADNNLFVGKQEIDFIGATCSDNPITGGVTVTIPAGEITFVDDSKKEFTANKVQSLDKSIRISLIGNGVIDMAVDQNQQDAVLLSTGRKYVINSLYQQPQYNIVLDKSLDNGDTYVYTNKKNNTVIIEDISLDDPAKTKGTEFLLATTASMSGQLTQDGKIAIVIEDLNGNILKDENGQDIYYFKSYKAGDYIENLYYEALCYAKSYTEIRPRIIMEFANEELINVDKAYFLVQALNNGFGISNALRDYERRTKHIVEYEKLIIGENLVNLASLLTKELQTQTLNNETTEFGNGYFLHSTDLLDVSINDKYTLILDNTKATPSSLTTVGRVLTPLTSFYCRGRDGEATIKIKNNQGAYRLELMGYKGKTDSLLFFKSNVDDNVVYNDNWYKIDSLFIAEDITSDVRTIKHTFIIPEDVDKLALIVRNNEGSVPDIVELQDIELDITPSFEKHIILDNNIDTISTLLARKILLKQLFYLKTAILVMVILPIILRQKFLVEQLNLIHM